jgi:hypothetical protein
VMGWDGAGWGGNEFSAELASWLGGRRDDRVSYWKGREVDWQHGSMHHK